MGNIQKIKNKVERKNLARQMAPPPLIPLKDENTTTGKIFDLLKSENGSEAEDNDAIMDLLNDGKYATVNKDPI